jgi:uncharacterized protein (TIGR02231 family)
MYKRGIMMKKTLIAAIAVIAFTFSAMAQEIESKIVSVKVFQNQAVVEREATVKIKRGENSVTLVGFPREILDWSVKSALPKGLDAKIMTVQVEQKMLVERFQKKVGVIEDKLKDLKKKDQIYIDELTSLKSQEKFVDSVLNFTVDNASKELQTRIPQVKVWDDTLAYCSAKKHQIVQRRREIENGREDLGKEIQKWEFELAQIAGQNYYSNFQNITKDQMKKKGALEVQQFGDANAYYGAQISILKNPTAGTDIEKRIILGIFSSRDADAKITFSYMINRTDWDMVYDIRASRDGGRLDLSVYGDVYQKTGEDWNGVKLFLSTGAPSNRPGTPIFNPWYLDIYSAAAGSATRRDERDKFASVPAQKAEAYKQAMDAEEQAPAPIPQTKITEKGAYIELELPLAQSIQSSDRKQKKFIKEYSFKTGSALAFSYEVYTWHARDAFLAARLENTSEIPLLPGVAQVFIENEYYGLIQMPFMPAGKKEILPLGIEPRIGAEKVLVKKFEDAKGVFGGKTRIVYTYQINIENNMKTDIELTVHDMIPVSQNEKIEVEILNPTVEPSGAEGKDDAKFKQGLRKYPVKLSAGQKKTISYDLAITYDKELSIRGLR